MENWDTIFGGVIRHVIFSWFPIYGEFFSSVLSQIQWYLIYQLLERFCFICLLEYTTAVELSFISGVVSCLFTNSSYVILIGTASCVLWNKAPHSASAALTTACFSNQHLTWTSLFLLVSIGGVFLVYHIKRSNRLLYCVILLLTGRMHHHLFKVACHWVYIMWLLVDSIWDNLLIGCNGLTSFQ